MPTKYVGTELDLFSQATNWKSYWSELTRPYLRGEVLEVGAGTGNNVRWLISPACTRWLSLEPDPDLAAVMRARLAGTRALDIQAGELRDLPSGACFDAVLYADVLEHIEDDAAELRAASRHLRPAGHLIVLGPAHNWLSSPFDRTVGHHRRYDRRSLLSVGPPGMELVSFRYLDAAGLLVSLGNRFWLRQSTPTACQILFWDRLLVPVSRRGDSLLGHHLGRSVLAIWRKGAGP